MSPSLVTGASALLLALGALGCTADPAPAGHLTRPAREPLYSPWVVELSNATDAPMSFDEISFKDVGLREVAAPDRERVYEAIAQSLSAELAVSVEPTEPAETLSAQVSFSEAMSDPANHLSCAERHVYVDLWDRSSPSRWGYSLWSGCSEDDRFAWRELRRSSADGDGGIAELTRSIAGSLRSAMRTGCFSRTC